MRAQPILLANGTSVISPSRIPNDNPLALTASHFVRPKGPFVHRVHIAQPIGLGRDSTKKSWSHLNLANSHGNTGFNSNERPALQASINAGSPKPSPLGRAMGTDGPLGRKRPLMAIV